MRWFPGEKKGATVHALAAVSCLLGAACGDSNKDVSGAYEISFADGNVRGLLYLVRGGDGEYVAVLNGSERSATRESDHINVGGSLDERTQSSSYEGDPGRSYGSFQLERDLSGDLVEVSAFEENSAARVAGKLERSRHAPRLLGSSLAETPLYLTARPRLPWDGMTLAFGQGVVMDQDIVEGALHVAAQSGDDVQTHWSYRSIAVPASNRKLVSMAVAHVNWAELLGQEIKFSLPAGTPDSAGKTTPHSMDVTFALPQLGPPNPVWELDAEDEVAKLTRWGTTRLVRETAECEGACLQLGRTIKACDEPGLAGQIDTHEASKLVVRVRTLTSKRGGWPLELGIFLGDSGTPEGAASSLREVLVDREQVEDTGWRDIELPLSAAQRRESLPVELRLIYQCPWARPSTGPNSAPTTDAALLIDRIAAE